MHIIEEYSSFKTIYRYDLKLKLCFKNKIIKEKIFVVKEWVKKINLIR